jgi:hypothetical protein
VILSTFDSTLEKKEVIYIYIFLNYDGTGKAYSVPKQLPQPSSTEKNRDGWPVGLNDSYFGGAIGLLIESNHQNCESHWFVILNLFRYDSASMQ